MEPEYTYQIDMMNGDNDSERTPPKSLGECVEWILERYEIVTIGKWISVNIQGIDCLQRYVHYMGSVVAHIIQRNKIPMTRFLVRVPDKDADYVLRKLIAAEDRKMIEIVRVP